MRYQFKGQDVAPQDIPRANQENLEACIHRALELGINHIETARGYGTSEMQLGNLLPKLPRDQMIVQTKVAPQATAAEFLKVFNTSMDYLKLDHVDLLSLHGINNGQRAPWRKRIITSANAGNASGHSCTSSAIATPSQSADDRPSEAPSPRATWCRPRKADSTHTMANAIGPWLSMANAHGAKVARIAAAPTAPTQLATSCRPASMTNCPNSHVAMPAASADST